MTSVEKLSIRGIRSFSPNKAEIIEFYKPLTLYAPSALPHGARCIK